MLLNRLLLISQFNIPHMVSTVLVMNYARRVYSFQGGVRSIWLRHDLENFKKRLKALEAKVAQDGIELNDQQIAALERKHEDDVACGEIETAHPGYLGAQDTFYVGNLKGVGRIYQQTFIDTYSKVAHCKLYTTKHRLQRLIYSMIVCCHSINLRTYQCFASSHLRSSASCILIDIVISYHYTQIVEFGVLLKS